MIKAPVGVVEGLDISAFDRRVGEREVRRWGREDGETMVCCSLALHYCMQLVLSGSTTSPAIGTTQ